MKRTLFILPLLLCITNLAGAQTAEYPRFRQPNRIYLGVEGGGVLNFSAYADTRPVDKGIRKPPRPTMPWGITLRQNLTSRFALETGISVIDLGYRFLYTLDYPGGRRWEARSMSSNSFGLIQIPVRVLYLLPLKERPWGKYLSLGANFFYNEYWDLPGNVGSRGSLPGPNRDRFPYSASRYPAPRYTAGLALGMGVERGLGRRGLLQVGAVANLGFRDIGVWDVQYTTWDISRAVDGITYNNRVVNRGSYVGLQVAVLFGL